MVAFASSIPSAGNLGGTYLSIRAAQQTCLLPIGFVGGVSPIGTIVPVSAWPACFLGHTKLMGTITPVVDLSGLLGIRTEFRPNACFVAAFVRMPAGGIMQLGLLVDHLPRLIDVPARAITPATKYDQQQSFRPALGTASLGGINAMILDVDRLLPAQILEAPLAPAVGQVRQ